MYIYIAHTHHQKNKNCNCDVMNDRGQRRFQRHLFDFLKPASSILNTKTNILGNWPLTLIFSHIKLARRCTILKTKGIV